MTPPPSEAKYHTILLGAVIAIGVAAVAILSLSLDQRGRDLLYSTENSVIEQITTWTWVALALGLVIKFRQVNPAILAGMIACLAAAAREADLHKRYTGYSVLKIKYYFSDFPAQERVIAGVVAAIAAAGLVISAWVVLRKAWEDGLLRSHWVRIVLLACALAGLSKALDRSPEMLEDVHLHLSQQARFVMKAVEEYLELLLPILTATAIWRYAHRRREADRLNPDTPQPPAHMIR